MYCENPYSSNFESDYGNLVNHSFGTLNGITGNLGIGSKPSLVLDGEKGELVKASGREGKKNGVSETKTVAALKSHSDAERRRRERINAHLATLRGFVPDSEKMDKATLLAEVICQVKQLKKTATQANGGLHIPMDTDEVEVEKFEDNAGHGSFMLRASLCCEYRPHLLPDLRQAIRDLPLRVLKSEISVLGSRVKSVFLITAVEGNSDNTAAEELIVSSISSALRNILEKVSASADYAQELFFPCKRRKVSYFDSSSQTLGGI